MKKRIDILLTPNGARTFQSDGELSSEVVAIIDMFELTNIGVDENINVVVYRWGQNENNESRHPKTS